MEEKVRSRLQVILFYLQEFGTFFQNYKKEIKSKRAEATVTEKFLRNPEFHVPEKIGNPTCPAKPA